MGIMTIFKARSAASKLSKGDTEGAMRLYKEAIDEGLQDVRYILTYVVLLIRAGRYQEARDLLVKIQRYPMADNLRCQLYVDYASCVYKMGELQKGIELLERQHAKQPSGLVYETLGYLYVEAGDYEKALAFNTEAYDWTTWPRPITAWATTRPRPANFSKRPSSSSPRRLTRSTSWPSTILRRATRTRRVRSWKRH